MRSAVGASITNPGLGLFVLGLAVTTCPLPEGPAKLSQIIIQPKTPTVGVGQQVTFTTHGKMSNGDSVAVTVTYTATGGTITPGGVYTAGSTPGAFRVVAAQTSGTLADSATVTITPPPPTLVRVILSPDTATVNIGATRQFSTTGKFSDSTTMPITPTYSAGGGTISGGGLYTAGSTPGTFKVIATSAGKADTSTVTIPAATLVRIILSPDTATVTAGGTKQFSTQGKFSDSSTAAVSGVIYSTTTGSISAGGLLTAGSTPGAFTVIATKSALADTSTVTVTAPPPTLVRIILSPDTATVTAGGTKQFSTQGKFSDSSTAAVSGVSYTTTTGTITAGGLLTAGSTPGTFRVIALKSPFADTSTVTIVASTAAECATPGAGWIWCDDFEQDRLSRYFEYDNPGGNFVRVAGVGKDGSVGMRGHFLAGASSAGDLHLAFGVTPSSYMKPVHDSTTKYREIYWRMYVKTQSGWVGGAHDKLSRAISFGTSNFAEAMAAHVWADDALPDTNRLILDPASGVNSSGALVTTQYNDTLLQYLGKAVTLTPIFDAAHVGNWYCVEAHVKLNTSGLSDGVFELWIDNTLEASKTGMNWVSSYSAYGINAVYFENYWNDLGAPQAEDRFFDNIVVSTQRIGC
jgi:hypothetical protein